MKNIERWQSERVGQEVQLVRWGHFGQPVLVFPTAGGDAEEIERMLMIRVLDPLISAGRIKVYSIDSIAARSWSDTSVSAKYCTLLQDRFDAHVYNEVVPAIRRDCETPDIDIVVAGASIGAFNALASICRHPDVFSQAICMSGTYDIYRFIKDHDGEGLSHVDEHLYFCSPQHFVPNLPEGPQLARLRERFVLMAHGGGRWEDPEQNWNMAKILGAQGVPNRVDPWSADHDHDWPTWREMLPRYLGELDGPS